MAQHRCPVWVGYFLAGGLRKLLHNPARILSPYVERNMTVLDLGCAMGFFSLPMAEMVEPEGKVVCVDVQERMLEVLKNRAARAGLADRIETHLCGDDTIGIEGREGSFDFALAFAVMHEITDRAPYFRELSHLLKPGARLLLAEPAAHVCEIDLERTVAVAIEHGFAVTGHPQIRLSRVVLMTKTPPETT